MRWDGQSHLALARICGSLPLEIPIDMAALHDFARDSAHKADVGFRAPEGGFEARIRLFYENSERKRLDVGAVGRVVCHATKEGAVQIRRGGDDANVTFGKESMMDI
ncbi:hypothetical protein V2W45_1400510 [Cenococcum geophilum]